MSLFGGKRRDGEPEAAATALGDQKRDADHPAARSQPAVGPGVGNPPMRGDSEMANIGKSISIKGDLTGEEDLVIEGKVEGKVDLPQSELTIGANGHVKADVHAKAVTVVGRVAGNVNGSERVEVQATGVVDGDVRAPRLIVQEGARINGSIQMEDKAGAGATRQPSPSPKPVTPGGGEARPPTP